MCGWGLCIRGTSSGPPTSPLYPCILAQAIPCSAKVGLGIEDILEQIVRKV